VPRSQIARLTDQDNEPLRASDDEDVVSSPELGSFDAKKVSDAFEPLSSAEDAGSARSGVEATESEQKIFFSGLLAQFFR